MPAARLTARALASAICPASSTSSTSTLPSRSGLFVQGPCGAARDHHLPRPASASARSASVSNEGARAGAARWRVHARLLADGPGSCLLVWCGPTLIAFIEQVADDLVAGRGDAHAPAGLHGPTIRWAPVPRLAGPRRSLDREHRWGPWRADQPDGRVALRFSPGCRSCAARWLAGHAADAGAAGPEPRATRLRAPSIPCSRPPTSRAPAARPYGDPCWMCSLGTSAFASTYPFALARFEVHPRPPPGRCGPRCSHALRRRRGRWDRTPPLMSFSWGGNR